MPSFGGPAGSSGSGTGSNANVYTPMHQPAADTQWWQTLQPLVDVSAGGGTGTPAGQVYPEAQSLVQQYLLGGYPYAADAMTAAGQSANYGTNTLFPQGTAASGALNAAATGGLPYGQQLLNNAFSPGYGNIINDTAQNPFYNNAINGAVLGQGLGASGAQSLYNTGQSILNTGMDPQNALFNRTQQQVLDQSNVANAMSGTSNSPYGASVNANALGNFDINWQNNLLNRQATAAGAASPLLQAAPGLAASSAAAPYNVSNTQLSSVLNALKAQNQAGVVGSEGFGSLLGSIGGGLTGAQNLGAGAANANLTLGGAPYSTGSTIANNALAGLNQQVNLGNNQYTLPEDVLGRLQSYMQLGQSASGISGQLGQMGVNQLGSTIGGALSGANALFGGNGLFSSGSALGSGGGGLLSAGGLLGSQGPLFGTAADASIAAGGPPLALDAVSAAPFALS